MRPQSTRPLVTCQHCGTAFATKPSEIRKGNGRFCSRACGYAHRTTPPVVRFWSKVNKHSGLYWQGTECWLWCGQVDRDGYGLFALSHSRPLRAHRFAYALAHGPIPDDLHVCHHCDRPGCVRDEHHFLGTEADNKRDMVVKGRQASGDRNGARLHPESYRPGDRHWMRQHPERIPRGENHPRATLTEATVRAIRQRAREGEKPSAIAAALGVQLTAVYDILGGRRWVHVV
jgi:hypothetical protein